MDVSCLVNAAIVDVFDTGALDGDDEPGDHPGKVAEEEHDNGGDEDDRKVAISRLLRRSSLSKFI